MTREDAQALDACDPLAHFRERFVIADPDLIYLDGNSLGRLPETAAALAESLVQDAWGTRLIRSWNEGWLTAPERIGAKLARLLGAEPDEVILADSTTVNLFKLAAAALRHQAGRTRIVTDDLNFPSDYYALEGVCELLGQGHRLERVRGEDRIHGPEDAIEAALNENTALLTLSHVTFKSGFRYDMARLSRAARDVGAMTLWDLSHSVGSVPIDLNGSGADLAVGCTYKYVNGGPGAPAFLYVRREVQEQLENPLPGWMGKKDAFDFGPHYAPADGVRRFLTGTPPVLSTLMVEPGVDLLLEAGMERLREKSVAQTGALIHLFDTVLAPQGFTLGTPRDPERRGSHVSLGHPAALAVDLAMIDRQVIPDFRPPDTIRLGVAPLYMSYVDLWDAVARIRDIVTAGVHEAYLEKRPAVT